MMAPNGVDRYFYRCLACCHVVAVEGKLQGVSCVCDGKLALMGQVGPGKRLVRESSRCPCDARCTNAPGPSCDCKCGGVNHGTSRVVTVYVDAGGVPRVKVDSEADCRARAAEYRASVAPHRARLKAMRQKRDGGRPTFEEIDLDQALIGISALRSHKGRMAALARMRDN